MDQVVIWMMNSDAGYLFSERQQNFFNVNPIDWTESDFETFRIALKNEVTTNTNRYPTDWADNFLKLIDKGIDGMKKQQKEIQQDQQQLAEDRHQQVLKNQKKQQEQEEEHQRMEETRQKEKLIYEDQIQKAQHDKRIALMAAALSFVMSIVVYFALHRRKITQLKSQIEFLTVLENGSSLAEEEKALDKETTQQDSKWEKLKPQMVNHLIAEYKPIISGDARAIILESVALRIEEGVQEFQSFLPPSVRLSARHYAQFLFSDDDVEQYKAEQSEISSLLEKEIKPNFQKETIDLG